MANETIIDAVDFNKGIDYLSWLSETMTGRLVEFLAEQGYNFSVRWVSLMILFISLILIYLGLKITKPILKWGLVIVGILLIISSMIPW